MPLTYIGTISKPHGIHGDCLLSDIDLIPNIPPGTSIHVGFSEQYGSAAVLEKINAYRNGALIRIRGIDTIDKADTLREMGVFVDDSVLSTDDRELMSSSLEGARVVIHSTGELLGNVREVWSAPAHRTLVVDTANGHEVLIPLVPSIVIRVSGSPHEVRIEPPEGLLDMNINDHERFEGNNEE